MKRWLGPLLVVVGLVLIVVGLVAARSLLAASLEEQRGYVSGAVLPLTFGLWCLVGGLYALTR